MAEAESPQPRALIRVSDHPPAELPVVVLEDLVPFPGPVVPMLLDRDDRRQAALHARHQAGYLLLINSKNTEAGRAAAGTRPPRPRASGGEPPEPAPGSESPSAPSAEAEEAKSRAATQPGEPGHNVPGPDAPGPNAGAETGAPRAFEPGEPADAQTGEPQTTPERGDAHGAQPGLDSDSEPRSAQSAEGADAGGREDASAPPGAPGVTVTRTPLALSDLAPIGVLGKLVRVFPLPDGRLSALVELAGRARPLEMIRFDPFPVVRVLFPVDLAPRDDDEFQATYRQLRLKLQAFFEAHPHLADEIKVAAMAIDQPGVMADFVAQHLSRDQEERLGFLNELDVGKRVRHALEVTIRELDLLNIGNRITQDIREKVEKNQREYFMREQLKAIRRELGEEKDPGALAQSELEEKLAKAGLPPVARARADEELKRLQLLPAESPEHHVVRSYLDWIAALPWSKLSTDNADIEHARRILDADHYGLTDVKERILEFLAVRQLNPKKAGSLLCFAGPPGVGKTSLGKSIAAALGREFYRFSVGGMRDEAEIKGHRRTYIGAMPGRILQGLKQVGTANPVFMLDELDKMGADWRGDPSSALLEVLDPAQNVAFSDHYLDLPFDLSRVMFIATVNVKTEVPEALRDRLEVIDLPGYIPEEKVEIALRHLFPREREEAGLSPQQLQIGKSAVMRIVREYTHEAGVRDLDRQLARVCRKRAAEVVAGNDGSRRVGPGDIPTYLGPPKIQQDRLDRRLSPGVVLGLAWTPVGGDVLFIEATAMPGKGSLRLTGQLGEVMSESANLALSYVRTRARELGIDPQAFAERDIHVHFPAGAVKKDGPSAGVTITAALVSLLTNRAVQPRLAMTGEMTLRGEVLPVGGIREKVVAARRIGVHTVVLPERNRSDVDEIPREVREHVEFVFASSFDHVMSAAFGEPSGAEARANGKRMAGRPNGRRPRPGRSRHEPAGGERPRSEQPSPAETRSGSATLEQADGKRAGRQAKGRSRGASAGGPKRAERKHAD